ncbi:MAG: ribonuclease HII [Anaerolineae bacterium]
MTARKPAAKNNPNTPFPHLEKELALQTQGFRFVAGLDEAGRGAWAGPVVAAAVILPPPAPSVAATLAGLRDSKQLSARQREQLFNVVVRVAVAVGVGQAGPEEVDRLNVVGATRLAMRRALAGLTPPPDYLLLDHITLPQVKLPQQSFPKAENISLSVAAASVVAKVTRDRHMVALHTEFPQYGFDRHKGYGTAAHRAALAQHGPCGVHRHSYQPVIQLRF